MLDIEQNRRARKYPSGEMIRRGNVEGRSSAFPARSAALFRLEAIFASLFQSKDWRGVHVYPSAAIYFPWNLEASDESVIGEHAFVYNLGRSR